MNATLSRILRMFNVYYDKIVALIVLLVLLVSLLILLVRIGTDQAEHERFKQEIERLTAAHPQPDPLDLSTFENARAKLHTPFQLAPWERLVSTPERRVHCVNCVRPIPYDAELCPFCAYVQPDEDAPPSDAWEAKHGINPRDPSVMNADLDGDGFTVIEEYIFNTDPHDAASHPPPWVRLRVDRIVSEPFQMLFMGRVRGTRREHFQINMRTDGRTYMVEMGQDVEGFTLTDFEERFDGEGYDRRDVSILTLTRGDDIEIELVRNRVTPYLQHHARIIFDIDGSEHRVIRGREIEVMDHVYRVVQINADDNRVQLQDQDGETLWVGATSVSDRKREDFN